MGLGAAPLSNAGIYIHNPVTASGQAYVQYVDSTLTATANGNTFYGVFAGHVVASETYTGLTDYGFYVTPATKTGTGTIDNGFGLYVVSPAHATTNYAFRAVRNNFTSIFTVAAVGNTVVSTGSALATTATDGFLYIPTCAGTPTGNSTDYAGSLPIVYDTSGNKLWINTTGTTWLGVVLS